MKLAVTGHRKLPKCFDYERLTCDLRAWIERGFADFYVGMALGFDTACFRALLGLKKEYGVRLIACVPCADQDKFFTEKEKKEYRQMLLAADEVHVVGKTYGSAAMMKRNRFMVDNADALYAFLEKQRGGSYNTVRYARDKGKPVTFYGFTLGENQ